MSLLDYKHITFFPFIMVFKTKIHSFELSNYSSGIAVIVCITFIKCFLAILMLAPKGSVFNMFNMFFIIFGGLPPAYPTTRDLA